MFAARFNAGSPDKIQPKVNHVNQDAVSKVPVEIQVETKFQVGQKEVV